MTLSGKAKALLNGPHMSDQQQAPRVSKIPFLLGDIVIVGFASYAWLSHRAATVWDWKEMAVVGGLFAFAGWLGTLPFRRDHDAAAQLQEQENLMSAAAGLKQLDQVARQITAATGQWQDVHATATKTAAQASTLIDRIQAESKTVIEGLHRATEAERQVMRLEIDKLRRGEGEFLQALVTTLDHTYALYQAGLRSRQTELAKELGGFRAACLDAVRRVGLVAHEAELGQPFNPQMHQAADGSEIAPGTPIAAMYCWVPA